MKLPKNRLKNLFKHLGKNKILVGLGVLLILISSIVYIGTRRCNECVYSKDGINISNNEYSQALKVKETFYKFNNQGLDNDTIKKDTLKELVDKKKIENYARENNIKVSNDEISTLYKERIKQNKDEDELLKKVNNMYGFTKSDYQDVLRQDILKDKVQEKLGVPLAEWLNK